MILVVLTLATAIGAGMLALGWIDARRHFRRRRQGSRRHIVMRTHRAPLAMTHRTTLVVRLASGAPRAALLRGANDANEPPPGVEANAQQLP